MTRAIRPEPEQLDLFETPTQPAGAVKNGSWCARHWPSYIVGSPDYRRPASSSKLWAALQENLPTGAQRLLRSLIDLSKGSSDCRTCIPLLAKNNAMGTNTCKRHLDRLLGKGLVVIRPWTAPTSGAPRLLGYEFRLIIDLEEQAAAAADGFVSIRPSGARALD